MDSLERRHACLSRDGIHFLITLLLYYSHYTVYVLFPYMQVYWG